MKITLVAGARPNFMKIAPIIEAINKAKAKNKNISYRLVHTGQHYDTKMSDTFFQELNIPFPDVNLECGGGTQGEQTAAIILAFEKEITKNATDLVLVVGDVNSTMACAIVAKKMGIILAHVEAGIRSGDMTMPEEINRIVTDSLTDVFFTTTPLASLNLVKSGIDKNKIYWVGNVMIDTLLKHKNNLKKPSFWNQYELETSSYFVLTLHRPSNVDNELKLQEWFDVLNDSKQYKKIIFPVHPRTRKVIEHFKLNTGDIYLVDPMGYLEFNFLVEKACGVITDSGGITEETTVFGVPCITLRESTERPETVYEGTNELIGNETNKLSNSMQTIIEGKWKKGTIPEKWDGKAANRIVDVLLNYNFS